tara:strand:- start:11 stop:319 length:309 start_codon:yes stop_codon:yes gene_type:complete
MCFSAIHYLVNQGMLRSISVTNAVMKTILTIILIIFLSFTSQAQNTSKDVKVETIEMTIVTEITYELNLEAKTEVARLYKSKNSKIKKELNFITKANKPKMA